MTLVSHTLVPAGRGSLMGKDSVLTRILLKSLSSENSTELRAMRMEAGVLKTVSVSAQKMHLRT